MGCAMPQNAQLPNIPPHHLKRVTFYPTQLYQIAQINHSLNINKKYQHLTRIQTSFQIGSGYKKTYAYYALVTKQQMNQQRKSFWETRVNGQPIIWQLIRQAIEQPDENVARELLINNKIVLLNHSIQMCLDQKGSKYQVPIFCINQPITYSTAKIQDKNLNLQYEDKNIQVIIRSSKYPNGDIKFTDKISCNIELIKSSIKTIKQLSNDCKIRLFYNGRQLKDDKTLGNYGYQQATVIQAMIL